MAISSFISNTQIKIDKTVQPSHIIQFKTYANGDLVGMLNDMQTPGQNLGAINNEWGTLFVKNIILGGAAIDLSSVTAGLNRIVSGKQRALSSAPDFISVGGSSGLTVNILGTTTALNMVINGISKSITTDIAIDMAAGFTANNTATINDADIANSKVAGEINYAYGGKNGYITIDNAESEIISRVGQYAAFKNGNEIFYAYIRSATKLERVQRRYFIGTGSTPHAEAGLSDNDSIELIKTGILFIDADSLDTPEITYKSITEADISASSPATGEYWHRTRDDKYLRNDGSQNVIVNRIPIAILCSGPTGAIGYRCFDFHNAYKNTNNAEINRVSEERFVLNHAAEVSVYGKTLKLRDIDWNIARDLFIGYSGNNEQASTKYYCYLTDGGHPEITEEAAVWREDLKGHYHPWESWRCLFEAYNDITSNFADDGYNAFIWQKYNSRGKISLDYKLLLDNSRAGSADGIYSIGEVSPFSNFERGTSGKYTLTPKSGFFKDNYHLLGGVTGEHAFVAQTVSGNRAAGNAPTEALRIELRNSNNVYIEDDFNLIVGRGGNDAIQVELDNRLK